MAPPRKVRRGSEAIDKVKVPAPRSRGAHEANDGRWWAKDEKQAGEALWDTILMLQSEHKSRQLQDAVYLGLYENQAPSWMGQAAAALALGSVQYGGRRVPLNLVKSVIDTAGSMIAKNRAELRCFTNGGSWREQKRAKQLTKWIHGGLKLADYHRHQKRSFTDGCLTKARGAVRFWADKKSMQIRAERTHPRTLLWNDLEGDNPRNLYQLVPMSREWLLRSFPAHAEKIADAPQSPMIASRIYRRASGLIQHADMIDVGLAWHQGYRGEAQSGRHIVMIEGCVLNGGEKQAPVFWPHEFFPFATFAWDDADEGWGGKPLADQLAGYQIEIGRHLRIFRKALERAAAMAGPWVEDGSEIPPGEFDKGETWAVHKYRGNAPQFASPPALGKDFFEFVLWQYDKAFAEAGISMLQSQGEKPAGVDAAVALREYNDITATRQVDKGQRHEQQTLDAGRIYFALSKELYAGAGKKMLVRAPGTNFLEEIDWNDVDMDEDAFVMDTSATSSLPTHFVGKVNAVVDMIKGGLIPKKQVESGLGLRLLQMPDLERETNVETAGREMTNMQVDRALYEGEYIPPEPYQDPILLLQTAQNSYLLAQTMKDVPRKNMAMLERLMAEADVLRQRSALNTQAPPVPGQAALAPQPGAPAQGAPSAMPPQGGGMPAFGAPPGPTQVMETPVMPVPAPAAPPSPAVPSAVPAGVI